MVRVVLSFCTSLLVMLGVVAASPATQRRNLVGNLKKPDVVSGCGCYFSFAQSPRGTMFASSSADRETWMNIDGKDTRLNFVSETEPTRTNSRGGERVGSRHTERYVAGDVTVEVLFTATQVCGPKDVQCEGTEYSAVFKVRRGGRTQIVRATGGCGC